MLIFIVLLVICLINIHTVGKNAKALTHLKAVLNVAPPVPGREPRPLSDLSEAANQQRIRLASPGHRTSLWRNNNGMAIDAKGNVIRFGLGNDSPQANKIAASSDLIGIEEHVVVPADVGHTLGLFLSVEVKRGGWVYRGTARENSQLAWNTHVIGRGGRALFATCPEDVWPEGGG